MIWYEICLPVYKQGDDLASAIKEGGGDIIRGMRLQAGHYESASSILSTLSSHSRIHELEINASSHCITVEGPEDLLVELAEQKLIYKMEDEADKAVFAHAADGWHYWDENYPENGSVGPFRTREEAVEHAACADYVDGGEVQLCEYCGATMTDLSGEVPCCSNPNCECHP